MNLEQLIIDIKRFDTKTAVAKSKEIGGKFVYPLAAVVAFHVFEGDLGMDTIIQPIEWVVELLKDSPDA